MRKSVEKLAVACRLLTIVGIATIIGCTPAVRTVTLMKFIPAGEAGNVQEKNSVKFEVNVLDQTSVKNFPELTPKVKMKVKDPVWGMYEKEVQVYLLSGAVEAYVQSRVIITNRTGHVLKFTGSVIKLMDDLGNVYDVLTKPEVIAGWNTDNSAILTPFLSKLKYLDANTEILPDMTWTGYVAFNMPMKDVGETFKIAIYDLTTKTDAAGNPTEKSRFEFNFKKEVETKTM